jgi:hypothetical protein
MRVSRIKAKIGHVDGSFPSLKSVAGRASETNKPIRSEEVFVGPKFHGRHQAERFLKKEGNHAALGDSFL